MDDLSAVRAALAAITPSYEGHRGLRSALFDLEHDIAVGMSRLKIQAHKAAKEKQEEAMHAALRERGRIGQMYAPVRVAADSLALCLMLMFRLEWYRFLREAGTITRLHEQEFVIADVVLFFAEARSLCDRLAQMIAMSAKKRGEISDNSLNAVREWLTKYPERAGRLLDARIVNALRDAKWFVGLRDARGDITHRNRQIYKLNAGNRRLHVFITAEGFSSSIRTAPEFGQGVATDFGAYAATTVAHISTFASAVAPQVMAWCGVEAQSKPTRNNGYRTMGVETLHTWLLDAQAALTTAPASSSDARKPE